MESGYIVVHFERDKFRNEQIVLNEDEEPFQTNEKLINTLLLLLKLLTYFL